MVSPQGLRYQYRVDKHDRITWVNSWWLAFARENGAVRLSEPEVIGRSLWEFIADDETCNLYKNLHARLRGDDEVVVIPCRCDSPTIRRQMHLIITGNSSDKSLLYEGGIVQAETHKYLSVLDPLSPRTTPSLWMCSCCKHVLLEPQGWLELEEISERLQLDRRRRLPHCRHTLCPRCRKLLKHCAN